MNSNKIYLGILTLLALTVFGLPFNAALAEDTCVTIHVPQDDPKAFKQAINIASNLPKQIGADGLEIEIVAQGPGLKLFMPDSPEKKRIESLLVGAEETMGGGIKFQACEATMKGIKNRTGKDVKLIEGIKVTSPGAAAHIIKNNKRGCTYMRI